jgi:gamma-glutamyltranspeptidase/glutathione hydrolase
MRGVVVCPEPPAADAGRRILASGGNAFDAAVAAAFAQGVVNPIGCGLGGLAFVQVYSASHDVGVYLNASVAIGSGQIPPRFHVDLVGRSERVGRYLIRGDPNQMGYGSIMTPGFVAGMGALAARFGGGRIAWADLVRPAAELAEGGFDVYPYLALYYTFEGPDRPGYPDVRRKLAHDPRAEALYMPGGAVPAVGYRLKQAEMARTLRRIAAGGAESFYAGDIGREIGSDLTAHGAIVTAADLEGYAVRTELPVVAPWRDLVVQTSPPPSHGAVLLAMLRTVDAIDFTTYEFNSPRYLDLIARVTNRAFADGIAILADPAYAPVPLERLLSRTRAARVRQELAAARGSGDGDAGGAAGGGGRGSGTGGGDGHTTHVTAADAEGNAVAITHSIGSVTGAGVMTPGLGFLYNNFLGHFNPEPGRHDSIAPGKRVGGGCPTIVYKDDRPVLAIGSSGGSRLISAVFQTILNVFVHGMDLQEAVAAPRIHCEQDGRVYVEPELPEATVAGLRRMGYEIIVTSYMGCNQAVSLDGASLRGGTDPRGSMGLGVA